MAPRAQQRAGGKRLARPQTLARGSAPTGECARVVRQFDMQGREDQLNVALAVSRAELALAQARILSTWRAPPLDRRIFVE